MPAEPAHGPLRVLHVLPVRSRVQMPPDPADPTLPLLDQLDKAETVIADLRLQVVTLRAERDEARRALDQTGKWLAHHPKKEL